MTKPAKTFDDARAELAYRLGVLAEVFLDVVIAPIARTLLRFLPKGHRDQ